MPHVNREEKRKHVAVSFVVILCPGSRCRIIHPFISDSMSFCLILQRLDNTTVKQPIVPAVVVLSSAGLVSIQRE